MHTAGGAWIEGLGWAYTRGNIKLREKISYKRDIIRETAEWGKHAIRAVHRGGIILEQKRLSSRRG